MQDIHDICRGCSEFNGKFCPKFGCLRKWVQATVYRSQRCPLPEPKWR